MMSGAFSPGSVSRLPTGISWSASERVRFDLGSTGSETCATHPLARATKSAPSVALFRRMDCCMKLCGPSSLQRLGFMLDQCPHNIKEKVSVSQAGFLRLIARLHRRERTTASGGGFSLRPDRHAGRSAGYIAAVFEPDKNAAPSGIKRHIATALDKDPESRRGARVDCRCHARTDR
jgi:hypothetical protein